ncbi:uncharacterized protein EAF01_006980 [Botrytis porri]|uniref:uncharacterized protein n=1 Tax=Botrytis porri TaxID=87229 RepID=UPI001902BFAB|nr:uncharacterized protein EAF01_006980 [Botrytis porri]KAF7901681.1 hypothetical protein EAF01_006980 [Botrytis porri]
MDFEVEKFKFSDLAAFHWGIASSSLSYSFQIKATAPRRHANTKEKTPVSSSVPTSLHQTQSTGGISESSFVLRSCTSAVPCVTEDSPTIHAAVYVVHVDQTYLAHITIFPDGRDDRSISAQATAARLPSYLRSVLGFWTTRTNNFMGTWYTAFENLFRVHRKK